MTNCIPVLLTPFNQDNTIDFEGLENLLGFYKDNLISRLWILGTGAEDMALDFNQRRDIVDFVVNYSSRHFKCLVGTSFSGLVESLCFAELLNNYELEAIHYLNYSNLISPDLAVENISQICSASINPVYGYTSANFGLNLTPSFVNRIKSIRNCAGVKYSTSNIVDTEAVLSFQSENFEVVPAVIKQLLPSLTLGAKAFTSVEASVFLNQIFAIEQAFEATNLCVARNLQRNLNSLIELTTKTPKSMNFLRNAEIKSILEHRGICKRWVARGFSQVSNIEFEELQDYA